MGKKIQTSGPYRCSGLCLFLLHVSCFLLVVIYVNMFQFWALLISKLGSGPLTKTLPVIVTLLVLFGIFLKFVHRVNRGHSIDMVFLGIGIVGAFVTLAIPDPNIPIKKIHVAEYIILSLLVRYTLSHRLEGAALTIFTALVVILLGVHDEMLQGFHSKRYYGWLDIIVNAMAGMSGAFLGHALFCFDRKDVQGISGSGRQLLGAGLVSLYILLYGAVVVLVIALYNQHGATVPWYKLFPLAVTSVLIVMCYPKIVFDSWQHHGLQAVFWLAVTLLVYPLLIHFAGIKFV